jgi:hypothetical protein
MKWYIRGLDWSLIYSALTTRKYKNYAPAVFHTSQITWAYWSLLSLVQSSLHFTSLHFTSLHFTERQQSSNSHLTNQLFWSSNCSLKTDYRFQTQLRLSDAKVKVTHIMTDGQSASLPWCQAQSQLLYDCRLTASQSWWQALLMFTTRGFSFVTEPLQ